MNRIADYPRSYRFVQPIEGEEIARAVGDPDAVYSTRPLNQREIEYLSDYMEPVRLRVEARKRIRVEPKIPAWELFACAVVAAAIGAMLAIGGVL